MSPSLPLWGGGDYGQDDLLPDGGKVRGMNIAPAPEAFVGLPAGKSVWTRLWGDTYSEAYMLSQVQKAAALGCNVIRVMGNLGGILDGDYDRATYLARWDHLNDICAQRGIYLYPCSTPGNDVQWVYNASMLAEQLAFAEHVEAYGRCIGLDIVQELYSFAASADGLALINAVRAAVSLPLTYSLLSSDSVLSSNLAKRDALRSRVDFFDHHWHSTPTVGDVETYYWDEGETKPLLIGEFGNPVSVGDAAQNLHYRRVRDTISVAGGVSGRRGAGAISWCVSDWQDTDPTEQWGAFDIDGVPRPSLTSVVQSILKE